MEYEKGCTRAVILVCLLRSCSLSCSSSLGIGPSAELSELEVEVYAAEVDGGGTAPAESRFILAKPNNGKLSSGELE